MANAFHTITWDEAFREFLLHLKASRAAKTTRYYEAQLRQLVHWAGDNNIDPPWSSRFWRKPFNIRPYRAGILRHFSVIL